MTSNPYESPDDTASLNPSTKETAPKRFGLAEFVVVILVLGLLVAFLLPARRQASEAARRNGCHNNMRQIALAIRNYESATGRFPPAYTVDENGNRLHSWRTLILPYLEEQALYESIDLSKPWDHPDNAQARETIVLPYVCPSGRWANEKLTTYLAIDGDDCCFSGSTPRLLSEITDSHDRTIMVIEVAEDMAVHWMDPRDTSTQAIEKMSPESELSHSGVVIASFIDNHTSALSLEVDVEELSGAASVAGGEDVQIY